MRTNVETAVANFLLWLSWYPNDYVGAVAIAGDYIETETEVDELEAALAELKGE